MRIDGGDNNDGVTVLDVTNSHRIRYCFANLEEREKRIWEEQDSLDSETDSIEVDEEIIPEKTPLGPCSYLWGYHNMDNPRNQAQFGAMIGELEEYPLIDDTSLQAMWEGHEMDASEDETSPSSSDQNARVTSLKDNAVDTVRQTASEQPEIQMDAVAETLQLPGVRAAVKRKLYQMAENDNLKAFGLVVGLLCTVLSEDEYVDLGPFRSFSSSDLRSIIAKLQEYGTMTSLNLSNNSSINGSDLLNVLSTSLRCRPYTSSENHGSRMRAFRKQSEAHRARFATPIIQSCSGDRFKLNSDILTAR